MKKIILACSWIILMMMSACSDWVDVSPNTDVKSEDLFTSESGFKSALIGIYGRMTDQSLYGGHMTFNFMEKLVQRYDNNNDSDDVRAKIYDYKNQSDPKNTLASIWSAMYQNIANINSLLTYLETNGHYITTEGYWEMIKGEALGLRAFHYFDLLRMWGPIYVQDSTAKAVPFRDKFNSDKVAPMAANELAHKILDDLREAEKLLKNDKVNWAYKFDEPFVGERGYRMNKYAVKALMARVYLWMGNKTMAAAYARSVINECGLSLVRDNQTDVSMHDETLFGLSMYNMSEKLNSYWKTALPFNNQLWISDNNRTTVFESMTCGINDIRYKNGFGFIHGDNQNMCRKYLGENTFYDENIPLIRLSEMYYIFAESVSLEESVEYINKVRNTRGISRTYDIIYGSNYTDVERREALLKEYQKEFFAEGQFFYFLKRHNYETFYRCPVAKMVYYVFPIPDDEVEFGSMTGE